MFSRTRRMIRRRFLGSLALSFAAVGVFAGAAQAQSRPYEPSYEAGKVNSGIVSTSQTQSRPYQPNYASVPNYSHLPAEDRAAINEPAAVSQIQTATVSSSGSGLDRSDWMRGIAFAFGLLAATAFALVMARGSMRTAHS
jgi:hypothetical protein